MKTRSSARKKVSTSTKKVNKKVENARRRSETHVSSFATENAADTNSANDLSVDTESEIKDLNNLPLSFVIDTKPAETIPNDFLFFEDRSSSVVTEDFTERDNSITRSLKNTTTDDELNVTEIQRKEPPGLDPGLDMETYFDFDKDDRVTLKTKSNTIQNVLMKSAQSKLLQKSVLTPDFEQKEAVPPYKVAKHKLWKERKKLRDASTGKNWYNMSAVEMTDELRNDIKVTRMRSVLDPKRFYKGNDMTALPKFVQVGTVIDSPVDYYHSRLPKKMRKQTIVEELLADAETRRYNKRKFADLKERYRRSASKRWRKRKQRR